MCGFGLYFNLVFTFSVDEEFELVATQVLNKTQAMVDKYRRLLLVEAEVSHSQVFVSNTGLTFLHTCPLRKQQTGFTCSPQIYLSRNV